MGVQVSGGFVRKENRRIVDERAGDGDPLLLAAAQLRGQVVQALGKPDPFEKRCPFFNRAFATDHRRHEYVFQCGQFGQEEIRLEDESHPAVSEPGEPVRSHGVKRAAFKFHGPRLRRLKAGEGVKESRLSGPAGSAQKDSFAAGDLKAHAPQDRDGCPADPE